MSLEEAEQATRIRRDYLEKLKSDDHSTMPEPIYLRGFIKAYASYLGLDGDRFAAQGSGRNGDGGRDAAPCGVTESVLRKA